MYFVEIHTSLNCPRIENNICFLEHRRKMKNHDFWMQKHSREPESNELSKTNLFVVIRQLLQEIVNFLSKLGI